MVLNSLIASFYILIGTFGPLLTFKGISSGFHSWRLSIYWLGEGISEYFFFSLAILGVFILRRGSEPNESVPRTWTFNPIIFLHGEWIFGLAWSHYRSNPGISLSIFHGIRIDNQALSGNGQPCKHWTCKFIDQLELLLDHSYNVNMSSIMDLSDEALPRRAGFCRCVMKKSSVSMQYFSLEEIEKTKVLWKIEQLD